MPRPWLAAAAGAALLLPGLTAHAQSLPPAEPPGPHAQPLATPDFVAVAMQFDAFEQQEATLAQTRAHSPEVRRLAAEMLRDHDHSRALLASAVQRAGLPRPAATGLDLGQDQRLAQLRATNGPVFDRMYVDQQVRAHAAMLASLSAYVANADPGPVRQAAGSLRLSVSHHLVQFKALDGGSR